MSVISRISDFQSDMQAWRQDIHTHPELGLEEERTSAIVAAKLQEWGIETHTGLAKTGVIGVLRGENGSNTGRSIGLRADLDALPMDEETGLPYSSIHEGRMHACGHDGHTTMLLGAARYLAETQSFNGTVNFIFQPAEENYGGAKIMMDEGLFEQFPCDQVFGMHNYTGVPKGKFAICPGGLMAAADSAIITITGEGGHAAWPHLTIDPIAIGVQMHAALQTIVSRNINPVNPAVVSVTQFHSGSAGNVIPGTAELEASLRSVDEVTRQLIRKRLTEICTHIAEAHGATVDINYHDGYPVLLNDPAATELAVRAATTVMGADNVDPNTSPIMGSEDFAFMLQEKTGAYILIGQGDANCIHPLHHPEYDFNDDILPIGASYWATLVEQILGQDA